MNDTTKTNAAAIAGSNMLLPSAFKWISVNDEPIPLDVPVLVYLEKESLGRNIHSATFNAKGISIIGHYFAWDLPKPTHWMLCPDAP